MAFIRAIQRYFPLTTSAASGYRSSVAAKSATGLGSPNLQADTTATLNLVAFVYLQHGGSLFRMGGRVGPLVGAGFL